MDFLMIFKAVILGIVEGITEFLPISSTGHMIIVESFIKLSETNPTFTKSFEVIIQLGAILSVLVFFFKKLWPFVPDNNERLKKLNLWGKVVVAVIPAVILGLKFDDIIDQYLFNPLTVSLALLFYGIILIAIESRKEDKSERKINDVMDIGYKTALLIGLFQCLAMVPGTSRSAATIIGAMLLGASRFAAAEFSFFLAIPTMVGASALKIYKNGFSFSFQEWITLATGFVVSFVVAYFVIKVFMDYISKKDFKIFGYYRIILAIIVLGLIFSGILS